ncbi:sterol desaturase family protein [Tenacibaculum maritimum]|uniref:sterol desaturase family protein n=1 Tax=Tenacibaculum maritimum TaxID=107401 RepID=UPI0012E43FCB|nr:sterol desaturase family protein [Tenacibaculum maritimum]MCD9581585.1 sterol desaturase family protein [Tenacibaculum maritimum]MCD9636025.1 sterol desaturase family protein [Tenacibaculum maritimum]CAA0173358.1 Sterol desaturase family protein [Tenacibaculum maritimum]CAA0189432.1 Sterol desaturase family protein [Tenacibaculum maritimum]CAA0226913.1 Sterol desaturase family protein [Tenacibaculum maritimum]
MNGILNQDTLYFWSAPFFIVIILSEIYFSYKAKVKNYDFKDTSTNVYFALVNFSLDLSMKFFSFFVMGLCYNYRLINWENQGWIYWLVAFIGQDFLYYIHHYVDHHSRFFWAVHVTHHNSEYYNISTGFRSPVLQPLFRYMFFLPLAFAGIEPLHIMFAYAMNQNYGTLCHTNFIKSKLGWWGKIFVTPSHHRVHHASNVKYLDKNMGMVLIIWDKIFGTFQPEEDEIEYEKIRYGLTKPVENKGPINIIFHEWKEIFKDFFNRKKHLPFGLRLKYIFMPPGWSHDGSSQTSRELQKELKTKTASKH